MLKFMGLNNRDASIITFYFVVLGIRLKNQMNMVIISNNK